MYLKITPVTITILFSWFAYSTWAIISIILMEGKYVSILGILLAIKQIIFAVIVSIHVFKDSRVSPEI